MNVKKSILPRLREIHEPFYKVFATIWILTICMESMSLFGPYFYGRIIDGLLKAKPLPDLIYLAVIMLGLLLLKNIILLFHGRTFNGKYAYRIEEWLAHVTMTKVLRFSLGQILNHNSGFKQDVIKKGDTSLVEMGEMMIFDAIPVFLRITIGSIALFFLNVYLGTITVVFMTIYIISSFVINKLGMPKLREMTRGGNKLGTAYWEIIKHLRLVIVSNQEKSAVRDYCANFRTYSDDCIRYWFSYMLKITLFREPFTAMGQFLILLAGIFLVHSGTVSPGRLVIAMGWSMFVFNAAGNIGGMQRRVARYWAHITRYFELLDITPAVTQVANPIRQTKFDGRIEFRNVSFDYPRWKGEKDDIDKKRDTAPDEHSQAIKGVSFTIEAGKTCAFIGHSGAGKSTVINLLLRGYDPDEGQILIDGHDLRLLDIGHWRKSVGCVEQTPELWDDTLRHNMLYGMNGEAAKMTNDDLHSLAAKTRIDEFYPRLGIKGFETEIGENGYQLSGGQRQRVAIARVIAKSPSLLVLDEATNALDQQNELYLRQATQEALVGRTGIIIAHRLSTIRHADQILVFEKGHIIGNGRHDELMKTCPTYANLVELEINTLVGT